MQEIPLARRHKTSSRVSLDASGSEGSVLSVSAFYVAAPKIEGCGFYRGAGGGAGG